MKVILAGGTGFIGSALIEALLERGDKVVLLTRDPASAQRRWDAKVDARLWNGRDPGPWVMTLDGADAVINLAGESVAGGRWTPERKLALIRSRVDSTRDLIAGMKAARERPLVLVNASAVGYYGFHPEGDCAEDAARGSDFLAALCGQWERDARDAEKLEVRVVLTRFGVVLGRGGGALAKMLPPFKLGLGGPLGSGRQPFPWVHIDDVVGALLFAIDDARLTGPVNVVAPDATTNAGFTKALGRALHRPAILPAPGFALRLALGEMASMLLDGQRAVPKKLLELGYKFRHPSLDGALAALFAR
ncbi:MAG: TIGR01777 family oxidoreductase [Elusimicrobiota bacterium]|nr:TIGR01777 family oxidoreductase [Elusimicrobiota bacterium]